MEEVRTSPRKPQGRKEDTTANKLEPVLQNDGSGQTMSMNPSLGGGSGEGCSQTTSSCQKNQGRQNTPVLHSSNHMKHSPGATGYATNNSKEATLVARPMGFTHPEQDTKLSSRPPPLQGMRAELNRPERVIPNSRQKQSPDHRRSHMLSSEEALSPSLVHNLRPEDVLRQLNQFIPSDSD